MKKFCTCALIGIMLLILSSCASSNQSSPSLGALNTFNAAVTAENEDSFSASNTAAAPSFNAGTLPPQSTSTIQGAVNTQSSTSAPTSTPKPTATVTPTATPKPTAAPTYTPRPTTTPVNISIPTAVIGEPKEHYDDIQGVNGKTNMSYFFFEDTSIIHADNYIYFVGGEYLNEMVPHGTYRLDTRTDKLEFFTDERMDRMFIAGEWLYYGIYDFETKNYYSYRMHSDGTSQTRLSYLMPDIFCCVGDYIYYIEEGSLYRRLISGEDQPVLEREPEQGEELSSVCTDGQNLYIVSDSEGGARIYKQSGSESKLLWTGDNIGSIVYDSGYLWGEAHWEENRLYILWRIDAETGEGKYYGLCEDYSKSVSYNIADGTLYICGIAGFDFNNLISMDVNFENRQDISYIGNAGNLNWIRAGEFCVAGDYFCFSGSVGKGVYESAVLFKNDGSNKYMVIYTDFPDEEVPSRDYPIMAWMKDDWMDEYSRP